MITNPVCNKRTKYKEGPWSRAPSSWGPIRKSKPDQKGVQHYLDIWNQSESPTATHLASKKVAKPLKKPPQNPVNVIRTRSTTPLIDLKQRSEAFIDALHKDNKLELGKKEYRSLLISYNKTKTELDQLKKQQQDPEYLIQQAVLKL